MKIIVLAAGVAGLSLAATALAQTSPPSDSEAVGRWYSENVKRPTNWPVVAYSPEAAVMAKPARDGMDDDMAVGEVRIERMAPAELAGMMWRSATLTSTVSCGRSLTPSAKSRTLAAPNQTHNTKMTIYDGQNLSGASRTVAFEDGRVTTGLIGHALSGMCDRAIADALETGGGATAVLVGRDKASLDAWAKTLDFADYKLARVGGATAVAYREDSRRGDVVRISMRTELSEPRMGLTNKNFLAVTHGVIPRPAEGTRTLVSNSRPAWIRSSLVNQEFDCKKRTGKQLKRSHFDQPGLKGLLDDLPGTNVVTKLTETSDLWEAYRWACPA